MPVDKKNGDIMKALQPLIPEYEMNYGWNEKFRTYEEELLGSIFSWKEGTTLDSVGWLELTINKMSEIYRGGECSDDGIKQFIDHIEKIAKKQLKHESEEQVWYMLEDLRGNLLEKNTYTRMREKTERAIKGRYGNKSEEITDILDGIGKSGRYIWRYKDRIDAVLKSYDNSLTYEEIDSLVNGVAKRKRLSRETRSQLDELRRQLHRRTHAADTKEGIITAVKEIMQPVMKIAASFLLTSLAYATQLPSPDDSVFLPVIPVYEESITVTAPKKWPVPIAGIDTVGFGYGYGSHHKKYGYHHGIDFNLPGDSDFQKPIVASAKGVVADTGNEKRPGIYVIIWYPEYKVNVVYEHLDRGSANHLMVGEEVEEGDLIGRVGKTGLRVKQPHLHMAVAEADRQLTFNDYLESERTNPSAFFNYNRFVGGDYTQLPAIAQK